MPVDLADSTLVRALGLVRLLAAADTVSTADRRATLWTVCALLNALGTALRRVRLFEAPG